jgi:hypothetical protein
MTRKTLHVPPFADFCIDGLVANADGSFSAIGATQGACVAVPPPPPPPDGPPGRITSSSIAYVPSTGHYRMGVDLREYANLFGHATPDDDLIPFPGRSNSMPTILVFPKNGYVALHFRVPDDISPYRFGWIGRQEYNYGQDLTSSISATPGDFNPMTALSVVSGQSGQALSKWRTSTQAANNGALVLPGHDYFYNLKMTDPTRHSPTCSDGATFCVIGLVNNFGGR